MKQGRDPDPLALTPGEALDEAMPETAGGREFQRPLNRRVIPVRKYPERAGVGIPTLFDQLLHHHPQNGAR